MLQNGGEGMDYTSAARCKMEGGGRDGLYKRCTLQMEGGKGWIIQALHALNTKCMHKHIRIHTRYAVYTGT